jgi:2-hydroxycyclohexanecarboxyl-CoA dehydrogenase
VERAAAAFEAECGPAEGLANVAGWDTPVNFLDTDRALWDRVIQINLYGPMIMHHVVLRGMAERGAGRVVNVASDAGRVGSSGEAVYSACKGGIIAFTKTLARELARKGVTLNAVCPGPTDTPLFSAQPERMREALTRAIPFRRIAQPEEIGEAVMFFLGRRSDYITGQVLSVSGGLTMVD